MRLTKSHNIVFLIPVVALLIGLLATAGDIRQSEAQRNELLQQRFESDAALRMLVRDALAQRLQTHLQGFLQALATTSSGELEQTIERAGNILSNNYGSDAASQIVHFYVATVDAEQRVLILHAYPRPELVGREIAQHPMLRDFDFSSATGRFDQIGFMASRENDLSFTSESPVAVRRHVFRYPGATVPVIGIVKLNLVEMQRYIDSELRALGPLPSLDVTIYEPATNQCLLRYRTDDGRFPCPSSPLDDALQFVSERNGLRTIISATPEYLKLFKANYPDSVTLELMFTLVATVIALLVALIIRGRLARADQEVTAYRGSLDSKEELTEAIHTIVADNLTQLVALAQRVKEAPSMADAERRYLDIAQSEMSQMRLSLDAKIMADRNAQGHKHTEGDGETFSVDEVAKTVEAELKRLGSDEGIETRVLLDDSLKTDIEGSAYWVESALLAFINASLTFTDEGFIELSLWTEASKSGEPELLARIRDAGVEWSLDPPELDHASLTVLKDILKGLGAAIYSTPASITGSQEHVIRFNRA
jgi:signal transduction histidine kinase